MDREEIERSFVGTGWGWQVCESSSPHLLLVGVGSGVVLRIPVVFAAT